MAIIVTASVSPSGCGHRVLTASKDGGPPVTLIAHESELLAELSAAEVLDMIRLGIRWRRQSGLTLAQLAHRVIVGDEATNVKIYQFFGPGAAIVKTDIGTAYVNICPGANGERQVADFSGCTEYKLMLHANLVGSGQIGARIVRDGDNEVLHEQANLNGTGEVERETAWLPLPAAFLGQGQVFLRAQAKSTTAGDDPVFRSLKVGLR